MEQPQAAPAHIQPQGPEGGQGHQGKEPVRQTAQPGQLFPGRAEEIVAGAQPGPQGRRPEETEGLGAGPHWPKSRRRKPPWLRGSS